MLGEKKPSPVSMSTLMQRDPGLKAAGSRERFEVRFNEEEKDCPTYLWTFLILVAAYCAWVFSLPLFPTQDDAMHLYYTGVVRHLLSHSSTFNAAYLIRIPPPPYIVHYLLLLLFTSFVNAVIAEKCMVCLILISTAFGFRFLSKAVGRHGGLMALWIVPVILSWPLFMGFHNYCLGLSFSLWGYGIWLRARGTNKRKLWTVFLLIVVLVLFTHPVPLLFLLGITLLDLTVRVFQEKSTGKATWNAIAGRMKWDIACSLIGCLALFYTSLFIEKNMAGRVLPIHISRWEMLSGFARLQWMCFGTGGLSTKLYRIGLYGALALGFALGIQRFRARPTTRRGVTAEPLLIAALFLMIVLPFLPPNMNGSEHFADRLPILVWICVLAAASSAARLNPAARNAIAVFGFVFSVTTLAFADRLIRPAASDIARIERVPVTKHKMGLLLDGPTQVQDDRLTFNPYLRWVGGRYFRRSDAVLLNAPWLSPPFPLPIQRRQNRFTSEFSPLDLLDPATLHNRLMNSAADRESLLSSVDVLLFIGKPQQGPSPDPLLTLDAARRWKCTASEWYFVCERTQQGFSSTLASASMPRSQHRRVETSR